MDRDQRRRIKRRQRSHDRPFRQPPQASPRQLRTGQDRLRVRQPWRPSPARHHPKKWQPKPVGPQMSPRSARDGRFHVEHGSDDSGNFLFDVRKTSTATTPTVPAGNCAFAQPLNEKGQGRSDGKIADGEVSIDLRNAGLSERYVSFFAVLWPGRQSAIPDGKPRIAAAFDEPGRSERSRPRPPLFLIDGDGAGRRRRDYCPGGEGDVRLSAAQHRTLDRGHQIDSSGSPHLFVDGDNLGTQRRATARSTAFAPPSSVSLSTFIAFIVPVSSENTGRSFCKPAATRARCDHRRYACGSTDQRRCCRPTFWRQSMRRWLWRPLRLSTCGLRRRNHIGFEFAPHLLGRASHARSCAPWFPSAA